MSAENLSLTGGTLQVSAGQVADINASLTFNGGTFSTGILDVATATSVSITANSNNRLSAVTLRGTLDLAVSSATLRVSGGLVFDNATINLSGASARLASDATQTFSGTGTIAVPNPTVGATRSFLLEGANTLTLGPGITVSGGNLAIGAQQFIGGTNALINNGTIRADGGTLTFAVPMGPAGTLTAGGAFVIANGGRLATTYNASVLDLNLTILGTGNGFAGNLTGPNGLILQ